MKLYLSGPMTGIADYNYPAFHAGRDALSAAGYEVLSPADLPIRDDWEWIDYILADIDSVFECDGVATLNGCEASKGSRIECRIAERRGLLVRPLADWLKVALDLEKVVEMINILRSNVIATQSASWSNMIYPLVAILNAAGIEQIESSEDQIANHLFCYGGAGGYPGHEKREPGREMHEPGYQDRVSARHIMERREDLTHKG